MVKIKIDTIEKEVASGTTILEAAESCGITIPTMCYVKEFAPLTSCMVCVVKDKRSGKMIPSCSMRVSDGMDIDASSEEIKKARQTALELMLADHVGDCIGPCERTCPARIDIPLMNRLISEGNFKEAIKVVKEDIALPGVLGYICSAPCEKSCKRKAIDETVGICKLKRFVAEQDLKSDHPYIPVKEKNSRKKVAIIGAGPAGLAAAYYLQIMGHNCSVYDKNDQPGGAIRYDIPEGRCPHWVLDGEIDVIKKLGVVFIQNTSVDKKTFEKLQKEYDAVVLTTGTIGDLSGFDLGTEMTKTGVRIDKNTMATSIQGVFAGGNALTDSRMAVKAVAHGKAIALSIDQYMKGEALTGGKRYFNSSFGNLTEPEFEEYLKEASDIAAMETEEGFTLKQAILESERCLHCDCRKADNCKLRDYADEYDAKQRTYKTGTRNPVKKYFQHKNLVYEPEKCIRCGLCIQVTRQEGEKLGLTYAGRGFAMKIGVPFDDSMDKILEETAKKCAFYCPTGALASKKSIP